MNGKKLTLLILLCLIFLSCSRTKVIVVDVGNNQINIDTTVLRQTDYEIKLEHLINDGLRIAGIAQRYYERDVYLGGGGNSFHGFAIPYQLIESEYGYYSLMNVSLRQLTVKGISRIIHAEVDSRTEIHIILTSENMHVSIIY